MQFLNRAFLVLLVMFAGAAAVLAQELTELKIAAVGDIMLGGTGKPEFERFGYDYPFEKTRALLKQSHIVFGNLEGPLTHADHAPVAKKYLYRSPPEKVAPALLNAGFNVVSLANNHAMDQGVEGLKHTLDALDLVGIKHTGAGMNLAEARKPAILESHGRAWRFSPTRSRSRKNSGRRSNGRVRRSAMRRMCAPTSPPPSSRPTSYWCRSTGGRKARPSYAIINAASGRAAIDAGAAAVIGHHPHVLQGVERYKNGVIFYSLGNFAFGTYGLLRSACLVALYVRPSLISFSVISCHWHHPHHRSLSTLSMNVG